MLLFNHRKELFLRALTSKKQNYLKKKLRKLTSSRFKCKAPGSLGISVCSLVF